jgi:hypothetical protein
LQERAEGIQLPGLQSKWGQTPEGKRFLSMVKGQQKQGWEGFQLTAGTYLEQVEAQKIMAQ